MGDCERGFAHEWVERLINVEWNPNIQVRYCRRCDEFQQRLVGVAVAELVDDGAITWRTLRADESDEPADDLGISRDWQTISLARVEVTS